MTKKTKPKGKVVKFTARPRARQEGRWGLPSSFSDQ
jgi:hypothetical protein